MAYPVTLNGRTYTLADFEGQNYVDGLPDAFEDFVTHAGNLYSTTSTTSNTIGTGSKTFTVESSKPYQVGTPLRITDSAAPSTNWIDAIVTAYSGTTLTVDAVAYAGSGTKTSWNINIGGGGTSYTGTLPVAQGGTGATTAAAARTNLDTYSKTEADSRFLNVSGEASDVTITGDLTVDTDTLVVDGTNNRVGIGISAPERALHVESSVTGNSTSVAALINPNSSQVGTGARLWLSGANADTRGAYIEAQVRDSGNSHDLIIANSAAGSTPNEKARLSSTGHFLLGTTDFSPATNNQEGVVLRNEGHINVSRANGVVAYFNRKNDIGTVIDFRGDGVARGEIGISNNGHADALYIGTGDTGLSFQSETNNAITPVSSTTGADANGTVDLGSSDVAFKSLYVSDGVKFNDAGGSGTSTSSNLDMYEEGTWAPTIAGEYGNVPSTPATTSGYYTKIGRLVVAHFTIDYSDSSTNVQVHDRIALSGLPFASLDFFNGTGQAFQYGTISTGNNAIWAGITTTSSSFYVYCHVEDGAVQYDEVIRGTLTYRAST